jgi:hypothetical protein
MIKTIGPLTPDSRFALSVSRFLPIIVILGVNKTRLKKCDRALYCVYDIKSKRDQKEVRRHKKDIKRM